MPAPYIPFTPQYASTVTLSATSANTQGTFTLPASVVRVYNAGTNKVFIRFGSGAQTATTTDMPVAPSTVEVFSKNPTDLGIAAICAATETATVYFTPGEGA